MAGHRAANIALAYPVERTLQKFLPIGAALNIGASFSDICILTVAELSLGCCHERSGINRVQQFLLVERHTSDVDSLEPLLDLGFCPLTLINQQSCPSDFLFLINLINGQAVEILRIVIVDNWKFVGQKATYACDPLLAIENFEFVLCKLVEVNQAKRVPASGPPVSGT